MSNIAINITENGTTTLATAGKYCDRNIDVTVDVAGSGGGGVEVEPIVLTGDCSYMCAEMLASQFIKMYGDKISTKDITKASFMFNKYINEAIPLEINFKSTNATSISSMFEDASIYTLPKLNNLKVDAMDAIFRYCYYLREIPDDYFDNWDWSSHKSFTSGYNGNHSNLFTSCHSLRKMPLSFIKNVNSYSSHSYSAYQSSFLGCNSLDEIINLPIPYINAAWSSNVFSYTFNNCCRLKELTFATNEENSPIVVQWKGQTMDLASNTGWAAASSQISNILKYNSGITADKQVKDDATYQALKNDPDWFASKVEYSRYNHDSAVNTINSLPDTSAYLATAGGTNTIKFKGTAGSLTDGGAINTLTEEEIAVATAKGWTVTFV